MKNVTDCIVQLQQLTQQNLDILTAINDSFFTRQNHLSVKIGENQYALPSFISLENKLNSLLANFNNLVHAPESGEAYFNIDGNSRAITVKSYTSTPNSLVLNPINSYEIDSNDIFKDFTTPRPYINLSLKDIPNDITSVMVKKIIPIHQDLINLFSSFLQIQNGEKKEDIPSISYPYSDMYKALFNYKEDVDYIEYDKKIDLPIRKNIGSGVYVIESIIDDWVGDDLINYITIKLRTDMEGSTYMNSLKYRLFDETIEKSLKVGDQLLTFEGNAKMEIINIQPNTNTITIKIMSGEFLNLVPSTTNNPDEISSLSKLKFFSPIDFDEDKYVKISLEEDKYIFVAVSPLNTRMNIQSPWGTGLLINTYQLLNDNIKFNDYYQSNVRNVGDILFEITSIMSNTLTNHTESEYKNFTNLSPIIDTKDLIVTQINTHIDNSPTVKNIKSLYSQKKDLQRQRDELSTEIDNINETIASVSFDDTTGIRATYIKQVNELTSEKNKLDASLIKVINNISEAANNSEIPIENAKYRIRGFFDYEKFLQDSNLKNHVRGIRVQYRYKNISQEQGNALTINGKFIFSDWNDMKNFDREKISSINDGRYSFNIQENNDNKNEPSFNQIDIPITQGESVDIRLKLVYDFGWPFVYTTSDWSPIVNIKFPEEYLKNIQILDIIEENNNDIESNRFINIIKDEGILTHVDSKIVDQDITYFHKPDDIASGFYTEERRIIPLRDKLVSLNAALEELKNEVLASSIDNLKVSIKHGSSINELLQYQKQNIVVEPYNTFVDANDNSIYDGLYEKDKNGWVSTVINISLHNTSSHSIKLFSMFPGNRDTQISEITNYKFDKQGYVGDPDPTDGVFPSDKGVWFAHPTVNGKNRSIQGGNQFIYFRTRDINDGEEYYGPADNNGFYDDKKLSWDSKYISHPDSNTGTGLYMYPSLSDRYSLCIDLNSVGSYLTLGPNEEILIPIIVEYQLNKDLTKTMSFEIFPSLYKDPIAYTFNVTAKLDYTNQDKVISANKKNFKTWWGDVNTKFNSIFK